MIDVPPSDVNDLVRITPGSCGRGTARSVERGPVPDSDRPDAVCGHRDTQLLEISLLIAEDPEKERAPTTLFDEEEHILNDHAGIHEPVGRLPSFGDVEAQFTFVVERIAIDIFLAISEDEHNVRRTDDSRRSLFEPGTSTGATPKSRYVLSGHNNDVNPLGEARRRCPQRGVKNADELVSVGSTIEPAGHSPTTEKFFEVGERRLDCAFVHCEPSLSKSSAMVQP